MSRGSSDRYDASSPAEVLRDALGHALPGRRGLARIAAVAAILAGGRKFAEMNFRSGCEAADLLAARLGMAQPVRAALACTFERWNGRGQPNQVRGERIPDRLVISPKTADSHIQHIFAKIGCSTRGAAVLFALKHGLVADLMASSAAASQ